MASLALRRAAIAGTAAALALGAAACGGGGTQAGGTAPARTTTANGFAGTPALKGAPALDFVLRDQNGRDVRLFAQRGRVVLLTFIYTHCPDVCPLITAHLNDALRRLGPKRESVRVLAVTVDPARDTAPVIRAYAREHGLLPQFRFLRGSVPALRQVWQNYNVLAMQRNSEVVDHSAPTLLIDQRGRPRVYYEARFRTGAVVHDVRLLLAQRAGAATG
jgi:protein SCO1/2